MNDRVVFPLECSLVMTGSLVMMDDCDSHGDAKSTMHHYRAIRKHLNSCTAADRAGGTRVQLLRHSETVSAKRRNFGHPETPSAMIRHGLSVHEAFIPFV